MIDKRIKDYFERKPNASYLFFACMIFLFRVFLNWYANELQLVSYGCDMDAYADCGICDG